MLGPSQTDECRSELINLCEEMLLERRLILLSNRGPVEHQLSSDNRVQARRGTGGVVTALSALTRFVDFTWVASAMGEGDHRVAEASEGTSVKSPIPYQKLSLRYVVTPRRVYHKYYNVFCNPLLWFLQHYMWSSPYTPNVDAVVHDAWENGYVTVNKASADAVVAEAQSHDKPPYVIDSRLPPLSNPSVYPPGSPRGDNQPLYSHTLAQSGLLAAAPQLYTDQHLPCSVPE